MKKTIFKVLALTLCVMMFAGCMVACGDKDATYVIGATGPLTGSAASYGLSVQKGAQLAVKEIQPRVQQHRAQQHHREQQLKQQKIRLHPQM